MIHRNPDRHAPQRRNANPMHPVVAGMAVIAIFLGAMTIWSLTAPISGAAIAAGLLQVEGRRQSVQHPYGGVIKTIHIREGQAVRKGEILISLFDTDPKSKLDVLRSEFVALRLREARLIAERDKSELRIPADIANENRQALEERVASENALLNARTRQYAAEIDLLNKRTSQLEEQIKGLEAQRDGLQRRGELAGEELQGARKLLASGFTPKTRVLALESRLAELESDKATRAAEIARVKEALGEVTLNVARTERRLATEVADGLSDVRSKLADIMPKLEAARDVLARTTIVSPADGAVVGLTVFTEGGVIQPGGKLLDIVPAEETLVAEGRLRLSDVTDVKPGLQADVRLTSVGRSERPEIRGVITNVSADRLTDDKTNESYYSIQVRLNAEDAGKARMTLKPGLPVELVVPTRPRTFVSYLLSPLLDEINRSFRER